MERIGSPRSGVETAFIALFVSDHEVFNTIYRGDQGMMSELVDGIKEFTNLQLERR